MNTQIFYYTSTGNSLYVAKKIREGLGTGEIISITKALKERKFKYNGSVICLVYPIHVFSLPIVVEQFIKKLELKEDIYIYTVGISGGGEASKSFAHIKELLNKKYEIANFKCIKYISNYIRAGRNITKERTSKALNDNEHLIEEIILSIKNKEIKPLTSKRGLEKIVYGLWKNSFKKKDKNFTVNEKCISCEICSKICPVDNIKIINKKPIWQGKCVDCMGCINICPKRAINIGNKTINKERYKNPFVNIEEFIN